MAFDVPPSGLPVEECVPALRDALAHAGQAVLVAPPGAGKTTIVPLRLLDEPWLAGGRVIVLEPRRLATRAAARRMASLLGEEVGATVGYTTRDERRAGRATRIEVVTEGILTRRLQRDPSLPGVGLVIFDELHERNLQADLALALVLDARPALRPDLRLLAMSATLEAARVAALLGGAPVLESEGRAHEVKVKWIPGRSGDRLDVVVSAAVRRAVMEEPGDLLVFLPGAADIRRVEAALAGGALPAGVDVRPLFGALPATAQDEALAPSAAGRRRVVLATDIAETSLTVEGVRIVVDSGRARTPRFDPRSGLTKLHTGPVSRASAEQRAGRAGRTGPGVAYRLWSALEHAARRAHPDPEISVVDLAGLALELAVWGADAADLAFLDPPPRRSFDEARALLATLGAIDGSGRPTPRGRAMAELPLHPRLAGMVIGARDAGEGWTGCLLAALLEDRDVLQGHEVPADVAGRVALIAGSGGRDPQADGGAVRAAAHRARQLARRAQIQIAPVDTSRCGRVLALAYPDRLAQARGNARFRLRTGSAAWLPAGDPLAGEAYLAVAEMDAARADSRIRLAAGLDAADVEAAAGAPEEHLTLAWDHARDDLRARVERRLGSLVIAATDAPAPPGPGTTRALLARVTSTRLGALRWTARARALQQRASFARRALANQAAWPDLSDAALLASLDEWLAPALAGATGRADIEAVDVEGALRARLGPLLYRRLEQAAPSGLVLASGRHVTLDYSGGQPVLAARVQELFGTAAHPTVAGGAVPVVLQLLSPAGRPLQVTADLPGFWAGTWASVRKEMAGRYPKHSWPSDPQGTQYSKRGPAR